MREGAITVGSLFSGIGGLELGLEWAGLGPVLFQVEKEPFCREVLARHWPTVARFDDVCTVGAHNLPAVDLLCGGFPCQDLSLAGKGAGLDGERSGLWWEYARIVREIRPRFVVVENVAALLSRGLDRVLGTLATLGYDAWWDCIPAAAVGAPHQRDRLFVVAYAQGIQFRGVPRAGADGAGHQGPGALPGQGAVLADAPGIGEREPADAPHALADGRNARVESGDSGQLAYAHGERRERPRAWREATGRPEPADRGQGGMGHALGAGLEVRQGEPRDDGPQRPAPQRAGDSSGGRALEPGVGRAASRLPRWMDRGWPAGPGEAQHPWEAPRTAQGVEQRPARLKALGNAVSPAVGYIVGCAVRYLATADGAETATLPMGEGD